jgi:hypothetical protein
LSYRQ